MSDRELPDPETVREWATDAAEAEKGSVNLLAGARFDEDPLGDVERRRSNDDRSHSDSDREYVGENPAIAGLFAAAVSVARHSPAFQLQYPTVDMTDGDPWIVLEPINGALGTVSTGRAAVDIEIERPDGNRYNTLTAESDRLAGVLKTARPSHDWYPVEVDDEETFTRGMTTFELTEITVEDHLVISFEATTTPATTATSIRDRFESETGIRAVHVDTECAVERSNPDDRLRSALEGAASDSIGDYCYEWLSDPNGFGEVPTANKIAFGTGHRGEPFSSEAYETAKAVLERTLERLEGKR